MANFLAGQGEVGSVSITPAAETTYTESPIFKTYFAGNSAAQTVAERLRTLYSVPRKLMECTLPYSETLSIGSTLTPQLQRHQLRRRRDRRGRCVWRRPARAAPHRAGVTAGPHTMPNSIFLFDNLADAGHPGRQQHGWQHHGRGQPARPAAQQVLAQRRGHQQLHQHARWRPCARSATWRWWT